LMLETFHGGDCILHPGLCPACSNICGAQKLRGVQGRREAIAQTVRSNAS
jgi:hypothetical protein